MLYTAREARYYAGDGDIDIASMIAAMPNIPLSIELPNLKEIEARGQQGTCSRHASSKGKSLLQSARSGGIIQFHTYTVSIFHQHSLMEYTDLKNV